MRIPLMRSVALGVGSALLGLALIGFLAFFSIRELQTGGLWMEHAYRVLRGLQRVQLDLKEAEAKAVGYLLTRKGDLLKPCWRSLAESDRDLASVREEASQDALPPGSMDRFRDLVKQKNQAIRHALELAQSGQNRLAVAQLENEEQKRTDADLKELVQNISRVETWLLRVRKETEATGTRKSLGAMTLSGIAALAVSVWAFLLLRRQVKRRQASDELLKSSEEKFRALADASVDAFVTVDAKGNMVNVNPAAEALSGFTFEELTDKHLSLLFSAEESAVLAAQSFWDYVDQAHPGPGVHFFEAKVHHKDGMDTPVEISLTPWEAKGNRYLTVVIRDVSDRKFFTKTLLENEHRLFQFLEVVPVGVFVLDGAGKPYYSNQAAKVMLGQGVLTDTPVEDFPRIYGLYRDSTGEPYPAEKLPLTRALKGEKTHVEDVEIRREGRVSSLQMWGAPISGPNDEVKYAVAAFADMTAQKAIQKVLEEGEKRFRAVTDTAQDAIVLSDPAGNIVYFNKAAEGIFGWSEADVAGKPFTLLLPERLHKIFRDGVGRFTSEGVGSPNVELMGRRKDKEEFPMEISSASWKTPDGIFCTRILRDVTERRQAERMLQEREEMFRNLFEEGPIGMTLTDSNDLIVNVNQAFCRMLGVRKKELLGRKVSEFIHPEDETVSSSLRKKLFDGLLPSYQIEKRYLANSGEVVWGKTTASVVLDTEGKPLHRLAIVENITEVKEIEEMKRDLISVVSHQLKTPVGEINGYIENMLEGLTGALTERQLEYLHDMKEIGQNNYRLITDLLNASKIERGVISADIQEVPVRAIVEGAARDYVEPAKKRGLYLKLEGIENGLAALADRDKTVETLRNVINNALKCTDKGGITVKAGEQGGLVVIDVMDTGIGMSQETLGRLFTKSRVLGKEAGRAGAGLGLFIAKNFMKLQGGDITVRSKLGEGTTFQLSLPKINHLEEVGHEQR